VESRCYELSQSAEISNGNPQTVVGVHERGGTMPGSGRLIFFPNWVPFGITLCLSIFLFGCTRVRVAGPPTPQVPRPPLLTLGDPSMTLLLCVPRTMYGSLGACLRKATVGSR